MKLRLNEVQVMVILSSVTLIMTGALFSYHLITWNLETEQLQKIKELASNPQTTLQEQRQLFADVRQVLENQQKILQNLGVKSND